MARAILSVVLVVLLNILVGCNDVDNSSAKLMLVRTKTPLGPVAAIEVAKASETDIVEQMVANRQAYRHGLKALAEYYSKEGNNMKLQWAKKELASLEGILQYNYIVEASLAGPDLRANTSIHEANYLYEEAVKLEKKAKELVVIVDEKALINALDKYNELIKRYPSSDKIDDAAYNAAGIYEHFKDYTIAALYYQRADQWDPRSQYPALFKAAYVLDRRLHRLSEALELYQQAVKKEGVYRTYKDFAEMRIAELTKSDEAGQ